MNKLRNWDTTPAQMGGGFEPLTPGGHIVKIMRAEVATSRNNGREMMVLTVDIDEGTQNDGYFRRVFDARKSTGDGRTLPKWPNGGMYYRLTTADNGDADPRFKGLIKAIEESNAGYRWDWNEAGLRGKRVGMIYREEEFETQDGQIKTTVKPMAVCPASEAMDKPAPRKKTVSAAPESGFTPVSDDDLLFDLFGRKVVM